jgi:selenocysteine lyase/cysteine desulfurase
MEVTRKQLLAGGAALALAGCGAKKQERPAKPRAGLDPAYRHFDAFRFAAHDKPVRDAIERHRSGLDAGAAAYLHEHQVQLERAVAEAAANHLGAETGELAFTDSTTMGLGLVYSGLLEPGDEVVTTAHDHYATYDGMDAQTVVSRLQERRIRASVTPYATEYARLGTSLHVDEADVDAAVSSVKGLRG